LKECTKTTVLQHHRAIDVHLKLIGLDETELPRQPLIHRSVRLYVWWTGE
jgi:hypothetical protein